MDGDATRSAARKLAVEWVWNHATWGHADWIEGRGELDCEDTTGLAKVVQAAIDAAVQAETLRCLGMVDAYLVPGRLRDEAMAAIRDGDTGVPPEDYP